MKATVFDLEGKKKSEVEMPKVFDSKIREDIAAKCFEAEKEKQPFSNYVEAGKRHSASGTISHKRHDWKGQYGKGVSRVPRKRMWRRGDQFGFVGAETSGTRGGRRAHGPELNRKPRKINRKESEIGFASGIAATTQEKFIVKRYANINEVKFATPVVISVSEKMKTKKIHDMFQKIFAGVYDGLVKTREVRAGRGKTRGRKYKENAGILIMQSNKENLKMKGFEVKHVGDVTIKDLYPLGRVVVYTEKALEDLK